MARKSKCKIVVRNPTPKFERLRELFRSSRAIATRLNLAGASKGASLNRSSTSRSHTLAGSSSSETLANDRGSEDRDVPSSTSPLSRLPDEIRLRILRLLPDSSLYMLRQTCRSLRGLIDNDFAFVDFQRELSRSRQWHVIGTVYNVQQRREIRAILTRRTLCDDCRNMECTGELKNRLLSLWEPKWCCGCKMWHPRFFFPTNGRKVNKCVGLLGHFDICSHKRLKVEWHVPKPWTSKRCETRCEDKSHVYGDLGNLNDNVIIQTCTPAVKTGTPMNPRETIASMVIRLEIIRQRNRRSATQDALRGILQDCVHLCPHAPTFLGDLMRNATSEICCCDLIPSFCHWRPDFGCFSRIFECQECNACYTWERPRIESCWNKGQSPKENCFALHIRYQWENPKPWDFNWVLNLQFGTSGNPVLTESTKNVLWCDKPGCGTGRNERWLRMAKFSPHGRISYFDALHNGLSLHWLGHERGPHRASAWSLEYEVFEEATLTFTVGMADDED
ncbi:hypothetical protein F53441_10899 [Fusarium austroafricanum]|uniref:F-box domain-containing protein n=1 Tax=Fusarium austroafricanum TaxID=2364996 RepID=A0A8H4NRU2_9HYPO|nr:hypothetical protein F53441_10899 [Fusarium austroafricanum]